MFTPKISQLLLNLFKIPLLVLLNPLANAQALDYGQFPIRIAELSLYQYLRTGVNVCVDRVVDVSAQDGRNILCSNIQTPSSNNKPATVTMTLDGVEHKVRTKQKRRRTIGITGILIALFADRRSLKTLPFCTISPDD